MAKLVDLNGYFYEIKGITPDSKESRDLEKKYLESKTDFHTFMETENIQYEGLGEYESPRDILIYDVENDNFCNLNVMDVMDII